MDGKAAYVGNCCDTLAANEMNKAYDEYIGEHLEFDI